MYVYRTGNSTKVLLVGGSFEGWLASGDVLDVKNGTVHPVNNSMTEPRQYHIATALPNGHVIIAGGCRNDGDCMDTLILYNSRLNRFIPLSPRLSVKRAFHTATLLLDGRVLFTGRSHNYGMTSCEIYNPLMNTFTQAANMPVGRYWHTATLLPKTGKVLVCGGRNLQD